MKFNNKTESSRVSLIRDGSLVNMVMPGFKIQFNTDYGGTPLSWYAVSGTNELLLTDPFPGAAASINWIFGQDPTQASPNGPDIYPISTLDNSDPGKAFYAREVCFAPPSGASENAVYRVSGYAPMFWISHEAIDDAIPGDSTHADNGWVTLYHNIAGLPESTFSDFGVPIFFQGGDSHHEGVIFAGNKMLSASVPWNQRMACLPEGRFSCQVNISLAQASDDASAGIMFRREIKTSGSKSIKDALQAPGYLLAVNKQGVVEILRAAGGDVPPQVVWGGGVITRVLDSVNTSSGAKLELRVNNAQLDTVEIWLDGEYCDSYCDPNVILGPNIGLNAQSKSPDNLIKLSKRYFFDISREFDAIYTGTPAGVFNMSLTVTNAEAVHKPQELYRTNLPGVFVSKNLAQIVCKAWDAEDNEIDLNQEFPTPGTETFSGIVPILRKPLYVKSLWVGQADGLAGIFCTPLSSSVDDQAAIESHSGLFAPPLPIIALNSLPYSANQQPVLLSTVCMNADFLPRIPASLRAD